MSTKLRVFGILEGRASSGKVLEKSLDDYAFGYKLKIPSTLKGWRRMKAIFQALPKNLPFQMWIFREKKGIKRHKSLYVKMCRYFGVGKDLRKKRVTFRAVILDAPGETPEETPTETWRWNTRVLQAPPPPRTTQPTFGDSPNFWNPQAQTGPIIGTTNTLYSYGQYAEGGISRARHNRPNDPRRSPVEADSPEEP